MQTKFTQIANKITAIKSGLAEVISAKGVDTESNAPFSTMIENIGNISAGDGAQTDEWVKPHDWPDIEAEPLEQGEIRVLMCDYLGTDNNTIFFKMRPGAKNISAIIDWGDGMQEVVNATTASTTINHEFSNNGTPCDRGYNMYVVRIRFNEPSSAPNQICFYRNNATSETNRHNNLLWIYGDMQYFTSLTTFTCHPSLYSYSILLERVNLIGTNNVTNMNGSFRCCYSLKSLPQLDVSNVDIMTNTFQNCYSLRSLPQLDTRNVTNMSYMFSGSYLRTIPELDTSSATNMAYMFYNCYNLEVIEKLDTSNVSNMMSIFNGCKLLKKSPVLDTRKAIGNASCNTNHFNGCECLREIGTITLSKDIQLPLNTSRTIAKIDIAYDELDPPIFTQTTPIKINYTQLSAESLNKLMEQLPDGNGKTLDLKYNAGSLNCDPSIATTKNWTVLLK